MTTRSAKSVSRARGVARNALAQLRGDPRFLVVSIIVPLVVVFLLKVFWDALQTPLIRQAHFAVPGGAFIVHFVTYVLTAIVLVRERVAGTMERMFIDGFRSAEIVAGYLAAYTLIATVQGALILAELSLLFDLGYDFPTMIEIFAVMWLLAVVSMAMGMLVSNAARNEGQVFPFIPLVVLPAVFLSGMVVSIDALPDWARVASHVVPLRYAVDVIHGIADGEALVHQLDQLVILPLLAIVAVALAARTLREEL